MAYVISADLKAYSPSTSIGEDVFAELAERASEIIDRLTFDRIPLAGGLSTFNAETQASIKKATCAQLQTMWAQGGLSTVEGFGPEVNQQGVTIGKFSISSGAAAPMDTIDGVPVSPLIAGYLRRTGLLYRGL